MFTVYISFEPQKITIGCKSLYQSSYLVYVLTDHWTTHTCVLLPAEVSNDMFCTCLRHTWWFKNCQHDSCQCPEIQILIWSPEPWRGSNVVVLFSCPPPLSHIRNHQQLGKNNVSRIFSTSVFRVHLLNTGSEAHIY